MWRSFALIADSSAQHHPGVYYCLGISETATTARALHVRATTCIWGQISTRWQDRCWTCHTCIKRARAAISRGYVACRPGRQTTSRTCAFVSKGVSADKRPNLHLLALIRTTTTGDGLNRCNISWVRVGGNVVHERVLSVSPSLSGRHAACSLSEWSVLAERLHLAPRLCLPRCMNRHLWKSDDVQYQPAAEKSYRRHTIVSTP